MERINIDLMGPDGNAFALMAYARRFAKQLDWSVDDINKLMDDMTSGDYAHLLDVFNEHFGDFVSFKT